MNISQTSARAGGITLGTLGALVIVASGLFTAAVFLGLPNKLAALKPMVSFGNKAAMAATYLAVGVPVGGALIYAGVKVYRLGSNNKPERVIEIGSPIGVRSQYETVIKNK